MIEFTEAAIGLVGALAPAKTTGLALPCRVEVLDSDGIRAIEASSWEALLDNAIEANPWLSRQMVLAGLDAFGPNIKALALYRNGGGELIALLPFSAKGAGYLGLANSVLNLYQTSGVPLISKDHAPTALSGLLRAIQSVPGLPRYWRFPHVAANGALVDAVRAKAQKLGLATGFASTYRRAILTDGAGDFSAHIRSVIGKKRAKDIERNLRRLEESGIVSFERVWSPELVKARVDDFLALEASGWKGQKGTAFLSRPRDAAYARKAFSGNENGLVSVDSLLLDGAPIAVSINLAAGETLYTPKCAFDERYRAFGPGMILEYKVIEAFFDERSFARMDAATTVDGHFINRLWDQSVEMGTLILGPDQVSVRALATAIDGFAKAKARLKSILRRG